MKKLLTSSFKTISQDRNLVGLIATFIFGCVVLLVYLAITIRPSDLQVVVHYTSFGNTNFYRDRWFYLLSFVIFVVLMATLHIVLTYKILQTKGRHIAMAFIWMSIVMVFISGSLFYQVLKIASLS